MSTAILTKEPNPARIGKTECNVWHNLPAGQPVAELISVIGFAGSPDQYIFQAISRICKKLNIDHYLIEPVNLSLTALPDNDKKLSPNMPAEFSAAIGAGLLRVHQLRKKRHGELLTYGLKAPEKNILYGHSLGAKTLTDFMFQRPILLGGFGSRSIGVTPYAINKSSVTKAKNKGKTALLIRQTTLSYVINGEVRTMPACANYFDIKYDNGIPITQTIAKNAKGLMTCVNIKEMFSKKIAHIFLAKDDTESEYPPLYKFLKQLKFFRKYLHRIKNADHRMEHETAIKSGIFEPTPEFEKELEKVIIKLLKEPYAHILWSKLQKKLTALLDSMTPSFDWNLNIAQYFNRENIRS